MSNFLKRTAFLPGLILLLPAAPALKAAPKTKPIRRAQYVFIVSFDGGKPSEMARSKMPRFFSLARQGASTMKARTIVPSVTLPSHTSMLTGVVMEKHKITWNDYRPDAPTLKVPTIFKIAKQAGLKTALFAGKEKFKHLNVRGTLDRFSVPSYKSNIVAREAAAFIVTHKPNLCFVHFADPDGAGHQFGWGSKEQIQAFADADRGLAVLLQAIDKAGIKSKSAIIMSADHGGHDKTHGTTQDADMIIPWVAWGAGIKARHAIKGAVSTTDTAATALTLLGLAVPSGWDGKPVREALR